VAVKNSIKVGPLVFLLCMFVIKENIMITLCIFDLVIWCSMEILILWLQWPVL